MNGRVLVGTEIECFEYHDELVLGAEGPFKDGQHAKV